MLVRLLSTTARYRNQLRLRKIEDRNMDKCYIRQEPNEPQLHISFIYKETNAPIGLSRQFNFTRCQDETVEAMLNRITANVSRAFDKKKKKKKKSNEEDMGTRPQLDIQLLQHGEPVPIETRCGDLLTKPGIKLKILEREYDIEVNPPWVLTIGLPVSILSGFPVYPVNFKTQFANSSNCIFKWYTGLTVNDKGNEISNEHIPWEEAGSGYTYTPPSGDIGKKLKVECIPGNDKVLGPSVEAISTVTVEAGPGRCPFENRQAFTQNKLTGNSFRVVSYNILADLYCDSDFTRTVLHPYCPPYALHIDYRKQLILKELLGYNADIACLQEVDRKIFNNELQSVLGANSYEGIFMKKGKEVAEGLACFYRTDRFSIIEQHGLFLSEELPTSACFKDIWNIIKDNQQLKERILNRSTAGQAIVLKSLDNPDELLVVGNTHLYFHPDADHIRLIQGGMMIYWMQNLVKTVQDTNPTSRVSVILCGDFNSVPSCGIFQLFTTGEAPSTLDDWKSNEAEAVSGLTLKQELPLASACGTPEYTNFTAGFADCLDYIFYDKRNIKIEQVVPFPSEEELKEHTALPSVVFPSDHIALIADLAFIK